MTRKPFVAFDFDGVLHEIPHFQWPLGKVDLTPLHMALKRGWAVQIMTANDNLHGIAELLRSEGIRAYVDEDMEYCDWQGGDTERTIIISQRKMWWDFLVDDSAIRFCFGRSSPENLFAQLDYAMARRQ